MIIKNGVIMQVLKMPMQKVLGVADKVYKVHGQELVVTSALDGTHSPTSLHYYGYALDFRTRYFKDDLESWQVLKEIQSKLGDDYTCIFEGNHIHVQYNKGL